MKVAPIPAYHDTLASALSAVASNMVARDIVAIDNNGREWHDAFCFGGVAYGSNKDANFPISINGKATRKWGHVNVWRDEKGRYEVNFYIL
jgi:hypothetical protein